MCQEVECQRPVVARGLCRMHYQRARRCGEIRTDGRYGAGLDFLRSLPETDDCIEYPFGRFTTGYGNVKVEGHNKTAHSVSYALNVGPIPPGYDVCHNCGNRPCVNPRHLRADTHVANMADKRIHGTHSGGERNPRARLTQVDVDGIRRDAAAGVPQKDLATALGVSRATVSRVVLRRAWQ